MRYEILNEKGAVVNVIIADEQFVETVYPGKWRLVADQDALQTEAPRQISVGEFYDLFGALKYPILASTNPMVQALIKDVSVRQYVDLENAQLRIGLQMIVDAGFAIDVDSIISNRVN